MAWQARVASQPPHDPKVWIVLWVEAVRQFEAHQGLPPAASWEATLSPPRYVWRYTADTWIHFIVKQKKDSWLTATHREVVVIEVTDLPPP
jgi:hypothetical protein